LLLSPLPPQAASPRAHRAVAARAANAFVIENLTFLSFSLVKDLSYFDPITRSGRRVKPELVKFSNDLTEPTHLESEIREQGAALAARAEAGWEAAGEAAVLLACARIDQLVIAARGSSDNAARYGQYLLGLDGGLVVGLAAPWLYGHGHRAPRLPGAAVLGISQSGRSPDIVAVLEAARHQGRPTIAITNEPGSPLARIADVVIPLGVGEERSVAATKTYIASLHALAQLG